MKPDIEVYIDRIVLEGFDHLNKAELNVAIQEHLTTILAEKGITGGLMNRSYHRKLNGGEMVLSGQGKINQMGGDIARGIFNGINKTE